MPGSIRTGYVGFQADRIKFLPLRAVFRIRLMIDPPAGVRYIVKNHPMMQYALSTCVCLIREHRITRTLVGEPQCKPVK